METVMAKGNGAVMAGEIGVVMARGNGFGNDWR